MDSAKTAANESAGEEVTKNLVSDHCAPGAGVDVEGVGLSAANGDSGGARGLAYDLDFYEPDPAARAEDASFFAEDRALQEIAGAFRRINAHPADN
jgi:hypothetical protein